MEIWNFAQEQILGMAWLNSLVSKFLTMVGIDVTSKIGGSLEFFIYDVVKITILLCVLIFVISYIQSYFPPERSKEILSRFKGISANIVAALLGTVTPFCSCSSIPLFMGFAGAGVPLGVTFSFLISSPMVDLGSLVLLMSIFGAKVAVFYVIIGLIVAVVGGTIIGKLGMENEVEDFVLHTQNVNISAEGTRNTKVEIAYKNVLPEEKITKIQRLQDAKDKVEYTFKKVFPYILIGVGIGAFIHNWIPADVIEKVLGGSNPLSVILATLIGVPMYADIFGTIPVAEAFLGKGAQLGTILSFMMAVTTLSLPSMIMIRQAIKPKLLAVFVGICTLGIILVGYIFNAIEFMF